MTKHLSASIKAISVFLQRFTFPLQYDIGNFTKL